MSPSPPDAEALLVKLAAAMRGNLTRDTALVGIYTGGVWVAQRLHALLGVTVPLGLLAVTLHRDDFGRIGLHRESRSSQIPFEVEGRDIVLVDDVLHTGRTIRAALNELYDFGRPAKVRLAILVDRDGREMPIAADFVDRDGREMPIAADFVGGTVVVPPGHELVLSNATASPNGLRFGIEKKAT